MATHDELALRTLARALAPYLLEEFQRLQQRPGVDADYDLPTCRLFLEGLSLDVIDRVGVLFTALAADGRVDSVELSRRLGLTPRGLSGALTTPIKRRAATLGLPLPFEGGLGSEPFGGASPLPGDDPRRTYWVDRAGIAERIVAAVRERQTGEA